MSAINGDTGKFTLVKNADRTTRYLCVDCGERVILKRGPVREEHFSHMSATVKCTYYEHPNESQIHKEIKHRLAHYLNERRPLTILSDCPSCKSGHGECDITYEEDDVAKMEYRGQDGDYVADVALLNNGRVRYIFEIAHTHHASRPRPEPWFEITTQDFLEDDEETATEPAAKWYLTCSRKKIMCKNCRICDEPWTVMLPTLKTRVGATGNWCQGSPCIICKRSAYNPLYTNGRYRQLCKICLTEETPKLRRMFGARDP